MTFDDSKFLAAGMEFVLNATSARDAIDRLVRAASACVGSEMGSFYLLHTDGFLRPFVTYNFPQDYAEACAEVKVGTQCCGRAVLHKSPWVVENMLTDPLFADARDGARKSGVVAGFSIPVMDATGNCLGSLASHFRHAYTPTAYDLERQSLFAKLIAFALARYGTALAPTQDAVSDAAQAS